MFAKRAAWPYVVRARVMTEPEQTEATAAAPAEPRRFQPAKVLKGCGCLTASIVLVVGVAIAGDGRPEAWGSAIAGLVILIMVVGTSGTNGFWNPKE